MAQTDLLRKSYSADRNRILCIRTRSAPSGHGWIFCQIQQQWRDGADKVAIRSMVFLSAE